MPSMPESLAADRYGRRSQGSRKLIGYVVIGVIAAVMALGWTVTVMNYWSTDGLSAEVVSYHFDKPAQTMTVTYDLHKSADKGATCQVEATDIQHAPVGTRYVSTPAGKSDVRVTSRFPAHGTPVTGQVKDCRSDD